MHSNHSDATYRWRSRPAHKHQRTTATWRVKKKLFLFFIVLCGTITYLIYLLAPWTPPHPLCADKRINILTTFGPEETGGGPTYLRVLTEALKHYRVHYHINNPNYNFFDINVVFNFKCYRDQYTTLPYFDILTKEGLRRDNIFYFPLSYDQIMYRGCPEDTYFGTLISQNYDLVEKNVYASNLVVEIPAILSHLRLLTQNTETPIFMVYGGFEIPYGVKSYTKRQNAILYSKLVDNPEVIRVMKDILNKRKIAFTHFEYGHYKQHDYVKALQENQFMVVVCDHEVFGNAMQLAKSYDVPIFGTSTILQRGFFTEQCGHLVESSTMSEDEIAKQFDFFLGQVKQGNYTPAEWVRKNLDPIEMYDNALSVICARKQLVPMPE